MKLMTISRILINFFWFGFPKLVSKDESNMSMNLHIKAQEIGTSTEF